MILDASFMQDENFTSTAPIQHVRLSQWVNSDDVPETFSAPYVKSLTSFGSFTPGLQLNGDGARGLTLNHVFVLGVVSGTWNIAGAVAPLRIGGSTSDWSATFGNLSKLTVTGNFQGSLTTATLPRLDVRKSMIDTILRLTASGTTDLARLSVGGVIAAALISAAGNIGQITAQSVSHSYFYAGLAPLTPGVTLPIDASGFESPASIASVILHPRGKIPGFASTAVAANSIGKLSFGTIQTSNGGSPFGIATTSLGSLTARDISQIQTFSFADVHDAATLAAQIAARKLNLGDFVFRLV